jgi:protein-tyrosine phosphatase
MAELMTRSWADPRAELEVSSAGVRALVGHVIDGGSAAALSQLGIDPAQHRARQFEPWMAVEADLILTAETAHRDQVMNEVPSAFRRTFTLKEFAQLVPRDVPARGAAEAVAIAAANRSARGPMPLDADDLADPYRRSTQHAKSIAEEISESVRLVLDGLGLARQRTAG